VDPDVKITYAVFSGRSGCVRSSSVIGEPLAAAKPGTPSIPSTDSTVTCGCGSKPNPSAERYRIIRGRAVSMM
jgi:hypothetical protein